MYLNLHSEYSLKYGTTSIAKLVERALTCGVTQMALTDINNSTGAMDFVAASRKAGIKPIVGIEFRRTDNTLLYIGIARNREGFKELNDFLTFYNLNSQPLPEKPWAFLHVYLIYPFDRFLEGMVLNENEYIGVRLTELNKLFGKPVNGYREKLLALHPVTVSNKKEYRLHQYLRAIDLNTLLSKVSETDICHENEVMLPVDTLREQYSMYPFLIDNTENLLNDCGIEVELGISKNRKTFTGSEYDDRLLLEKLAIEGMYYRYGKTNHKAIKKVQDELQVIFKLKFCAYFLQVEDIVSYGAKRNYYHVGRGSGANSTVAYCLRITDVDPLELDLYFERFLNPKRTSAPDFDIDFSWDEREDVQDYIFKRYGKEHTALLGTMTTFKDRSVLREIGKAMGLPKGEIDSFSQPSRQAENQNNLVYRQICAIYEMMEDMPHQRSIHAGGVLISEEPITYYCALDLPPKNMPTVQFDMYAAEAIGYEKFDILSQRGIGHIKEAVEVIRQNHRISVNVHDVKKFKADPKINAQLKTGDTIGAFYIESPAMRGLLKKLRCDNYLNLVAASSIIRPGVASSGMMKTYIERFNDPDKITYLHPVMAEQLAETYGVMVYQEDVIKVCHHYAGLDLADADVLRRGMSGKYRSRMEFDKLVQRFFDCAKALGRDEETTKEVWRQVSSFAGYSFSKAHSASFAVESYQSLFLKTEYPREFMVAVLNNYGGFYARWVYVQELRKSGATVHLPCINQSGQKVSISGTDAFLGFVGIQGLEAKMVENIISERLNNGLYQNLENFVKRTGITLEQCITLVRTGALRFTGRSKKELLWEVYQYLGDQPAQKAVPELFSFASKTYTLPKLSQNQLEDAYDELELLGFPVSLSMFEMLQSTFRGELMAGELNKHIGEKVKMLGNFVCDKTIRTIKGKPMYFGTFLDFEGNWFDTVHFPQHAPSYPFKGMGCYLIYGKVTQDFGFCSIEVEKFAKLPIKADPRRKG